MTFSDLGRGIALLHQLVERPLKHPEVYTWLALLQITTVMAFVIL